MNGFRRTKQVGVADEKSEKSTSNTRHLHEEKRSRGHNMGIILFQSSGQRRLDKVDSLACKSLDKLKSDVKQSR